MAATLELKYYNAFWLKKMASITIVKNTVAISEGDTTTNILVITEPNTSIAVGQAITWTTDGTDYELYVSKIIDSTHILMSGVPGVNTLLDDTSLSFGPLSDFTNIPAAYPSIDRLDWYVEESRIKGGYNNVDVDLGVQAFIVEPDNSQRHRNSSLIYSGALNSRTGVNNTNQFPILNTIRFAIIRIKSVSVMEDMGAFKECWIAPYKKRGKKIQHIIKAARRKYSSMHQLMTYPRVPPETVPNCE